MAYTIHEIPVFIAMGVVGKAPPYSMDQSQSVLGRMDSQLQSGAGLELSLSGSPSSPLGTALLEFLLRCMQGWALQKDPRASDLE